MYDIIGDIHGYADQLEQLLIKMNYVNSSGYYKHPERKVIFVGDFIDRGPKIRETLSIVRRMVDEESAIAVMGNHEYNALCYHTEVSKDKFLREHSEKNYDQHKETLIQFSDYQKEFNHYLEWFRTLPVKIDLGNLRIVHACLDEENINQLNHDINFTKDFLIELHQDRKSKLYLSIDETLKGKEHKIPNGHSFKDKAGIERFDNRFKWWVDPEGKTYDECYFEEVKELTGKEMEIEWINNSSLYSEDEVPVFCGHYWLKDKKPKIQSKNVVCVDYSVAKDNILSAYSWSGEKELKDENFVWV